MSAAAIAAIDWACPVDWSQWLNKDLKLWYLPVPGVASKSHLIDVVHPSAGHHATLLDVPFTEDPRIPGFRAYDFDGSTHSGTVDESSGGLEFTADDEFTYAVWARTSASGQQEIFADYDGDPATNISFWSTSSFMIYLSGGGQWKLYYLSGTQNDGKWHQFTAVWSGPANTLRIYLDGVEQVVPLKANDGAISGTLRHSGSFMLGRDQRASPNWFNGDLGDARVLGRAWTPSDVRAYYYESAAGWPNLLRRLGRQTWWDGAGGTHPAGPLGHPLHGPMAGPVAA